MAKTAKAAKAAKAATKVARCRVCHRELRDAAHITAGIGPICAQHAARGIVTTPSDQQPRYPRERYERITRSLEKLGRMIVQADAYRQQAWRVGTPEQRAEAEEDYQLIVHWYERWRKMQWRAYCLMRGMRVK